MEPATLAAERARMPAGDGEALAAWWAGGAGALAARRRIADAVDRDPDFHALGPTDDIYRLTKHERYGLTDGFYEFENACGAIAWADSCFCFLFFPRMGHHC